MARERVNEIDLLRFLAALVVVFFHYAFRGYAAGSLSPMPYPLLAPLAKYGYLGVQLFFLISGFVILMTAAGGSLRRFFVSRAVRLYPAFWACCTVTFLLMTASGPQVRGVSPLQYLANMTMLSGFFGVPSVDGVYWSLFVELHFYALVALVLALGQIRHAERLLLGWLAVTVVLEIWPVGMLRSLLVSDFAAYFVGGGLAYLIWSQGLSRGRGVGLGLAWILALWQSQMEAADAAVYYRTSLEPLVVAGLVSAAFGVMLLVALRRTGWFGRRQWAGLGALTYPLYLLHQNLGYLIFNAAYPAVNAHLLLWGTVLLMLGAAWAVNVGIERRTAVALKKGLNGALDSCFPSLAPQAGSAGDGTPP